MNSESQIRTILFDFGGVIAEEGFYEGLREIAREQGLDPELLAQEGMDAVYESGYVTGQGSEAAFWKLLRQKSGITGSDSELKRRILPCFKVRPWMIELLRELRDRGYLVCLLSDQVEWLEQLDAEQDFLKEFDRAYVSYRLVKGKRDATLFDDAVEDLGLQPEEVLFVDDAKGNIERAESRGLRVLRYTDRQAFEAGMKSVLGKYPMKNR